MLPPETEILAAVRNALSRPVAAVRFLRKNPWPIVLPVSDDPATLVGRGVLDEYLTVAQAFGFCGVPLYGADAESGLDEKGAAVAAAKYRAAAPRETAESILEAASRYLTALDRLGVLGVRGSGRILRIRSLLDLDVVRFGTLSALTDFFIENVAQQAAFFGLKDYPSKLRTTSELQVVQEGKHPPLSLPAEGKRPWFPIEFQEARYTIVWQPVPAYSPLGIMFKAGVSSPVPNYFAFLSFQFFRDSEGRPAAEIACSQYNFVNLLLDARGGLVPAEESSSPEGLRFMTRPEEAAFRSRLDAALGEGFVTALMRIASREVFTKCGVVRVEVVAPGENLWLRDHAGQRSRESVLKSGANLYTKAAIAAGGALSADGRVVLFPPGA